MTNKWINVEFLGKTKSGKTSIFNVFNQETLVDLGEIKWHGAWRQYVFFPYSDTFFASSCLQEIYQELSDINSSHMRGIKK